jgi:hypothetical protein
VGRPREIPDAVVRRLVDLGVSVEILAKGFQWHPKSIRRALSRARGQTSPSLLAVKNALAPFRNEAGHFSACTPFGCEVRCLALRTALGETTQETTHTPKETTQ